MPAKRILFVALALGGWSVVATAQRSDPLAALETRVVRVQARIESVESVRAIKRLQYAYGHYVELGLWNDFADLFAEDAVTNYQSGVRGKAAIRDLFFKQVGQGKLGLSEGRIYPHILFQPVITLAPEGRTAKGRWRILAMLGGFGGSATWYSGVYENEYVLQGGMWKISLLHSEPRVTAAYTAAGWKDSGAHVPFHYTAASVTAPLPDSQRRSAREATGTTPSLRSLADRVNQLERRSARLNDQAEVTNLQNTWGYAMDRKLWDRAANLFATNGTLELGLQGVYVGEASIRHALDQFGPQGLRDGELNDHVYLQTLVSVAPDGRTAKARGVELIMSSAPGGRNGELSEGVFENTFARQDGAWKIQSVHFYPRMIVDAAAGWARSAKPAPGPSKEFPPDRPPTASYEIYPGFAVAPFHFDNPVTGKPPQYPEGVPATRSETTATAAARGAAIRNVADLEAGLAGLERSLAVSEAYDAAENLIGAYGYYQDESPDDLASLLVQSGQENITGSSIFVNQILQPVIDVAPDGKSAKIRARRLDLGGTSGGAGYWTAGTFEGDIVSEQGRWKFQAARSRSVVRTLSRWLGSNSLRQPMKLTRHAPSMIFVATILLAPVAWVTLRAQQPAQALSALDYAEIGQLANRYAHAIDTCSNNGYDYADLYTSDGTFTDYVTDEGYAKKGLVRAHGREELARAAGGGTLGCKNVGWNGWSHLMLNHVITAAPGGARGRVYLVTLGSKGPNSVERFGGYEDFYVKTAHGWRIQSRTHVRNKAWHNPLLQSPDLN